MRPTELFPKVLIEELVSRYQHDKDWIKIVQEAEDDLFKCVFQDPLDPFVRMGMNGNEIAEMYVASRWLGEGPKVFAPTLEQCEVMERVEVNLYTREYTQPYPTLAVKLPKKYLPFCCVICHHMDNGIFIGNLYSKDPTHNITTLAKPDRILESQIQKFQDNCKEEAETAAIVYRVACNLCLALSNYGCHLDYLYPSEVSADRDRSREDSDRGRRAKRRVALAVQRVSFDQEIKLHREEYRPAGDDERQTGVAMPPHWRRGHWSMQPHGPNNTLRKRIFRKPTLVRSDLLLAPTSETSATYKG